METILASPDNRVQGFLGPGHVCTVVGYEEYEPLAEIIGDVVADHAGFVLMKTRIGGTRVVDMLSGEQLPRIC